MFLYGGMMGVIMIVFGIMSYFYKYVTPEDMADSDGTVLSNDTNGAIPLEEKNNVDEKSEENTKI